MLVKDTQKLQKENANQFYKRNKHGILQVAACWQPSFWSEHNFFPPVLWWLSTMNTLSIFTRLCMTLVKQHTPPPYNPDMCIGSYQDFILYPCSSVERRAISGMMIKAWVEWITVGFAKEHKQIEFELTYNIAQYGRPIIAPIILW